VTSTAAPTDLVFDPYDAATVENPWALFRRMRDEAPLYHNPDLGFYALTRFADVEAAHLDREHYISSGGVTLGIVRAQQTIPPGTVIMEDDPTHALHRALLSRMFTPRRVGELESRIRDLVGDILDAFAGADRIDFAADVARQVPMRVIGMLLGIPEQDQVAVRDHFLDARKREEGDRDEAMSGALFADYVDWRVDHPSDDIMTVLLTTEFEDEHGERRTLTRGELLTYLSIVAAAGNETTGNWLSWTAKLLAEHPDQRQLVVDDRSLVPQAMEEALRLEPPSTNSGRTLAHDLEVHGQVVPQGAFMCLVIPAANRDEHRYPDPDRFDLHRDPGTILTFGFGSHYCLGQALARLEGRIVFDELLQRFPEWHCDRSEAVFSHDDADVRGWSSLPLTFP
jgi:cytochrome P450